MPITPTPTDKATEALSHQEMQILAKVAEQNDSQPDDGKTEGREKTKLSEKLENPVVGISFAASATTSAISKFPSVNKNLTEIENLHGSLGISSHN
jgi:hypothetical protein